MYSKMIRKILKRPKKLSITSQELKKKKKNTIKHDKIPALKHVGSKI